MELYEIENTLELDTQSLPRIVVVLGGRGLVRASGARDGVELALGDTWLLPASLGKHAILPREDRLTFMYVTANPR
jgi:hypothetical protein